MMVSKEEMVDVLKTAAISRFFFCPCLYLAIGVSSWANLIAKFCWLMLLLPVVVLVLVASIQYVVDEVILVGALGHCKDRWKTAEEWVVPRS